ncbi:MAG: glycoside hydrolase [Rhodothermia bacterium]|nr:glycoside hydrolase [Rhodothermia bacterium]
MKRLIVTALTAASALFSAQAIADIVDYEPIEGPSMVSDGASTNKVKIARTSDGTIFAIYGETQDVDLSGNSLVWNAKASKTQKPNDIVIKYSTDKGATWSDALNIDNTAALSSGRGILVAEGMPLLDPLTETPDLVNDPNAVDYPGDSDKPNVFNVGNNIVVTFSSKYCAGGEQRFIVYPELNGITIPYSCLHAARLVWNPKTKAFNTYDAWAGLPYKTEQLTTGIRDVKQDAHRGNKFAHVANWQEDPLGLKLGEGAGPGHGASGANVNHGTDIWFAHLPVLNAEGTGPDTARFVNESWSVPVRVTSNVFMSGPLQGRDVATHAPGDYDRGNVGAARSNIGLIDDNVVMAYEETKGTEGCEDGKYVRFQSFRFDSPPLGGAHGCIISDPTQNARRVRLLVQSATNEVPLLFIYKQGDYTQGGPSDIMLRRAVGGFQPENLQPAVDVENCRASILDGLDPISMIRPEVHEAAMNLSGSREIGGQAGTGVMGEVIDTDANPLESALAHRGMMRGSKILLGYSYVPDLAQFLYLDDATPYNFLVRRSTDGGATWSDAINLTPEVTAESGYTVKEPRIVKAPKSTPKCPTNPTDCLDPNVIYVAYGLQENVYDHYEEAGDVDIYMRVTMDGGQSFSAPQSLTGGDALFGAPDAIEDFETQIRMRPDGREAYIVWSGYDGTAKNALYRKALVVGDTLEVSTVSNITSQVTVIPAEQSHVTLTDVSWGSLAGLPEVPLDYDFPHGVLDFTVTNVNAGTSIDVTVIFEEPLPAGTEYFKYGPTLDNVADHWYSVPAVIEGNTITYTITDGQNGDNDLTVNGIIVDPAAPVVFSPAPAPVTPNVSSGGSSGGCTMSGDNTQNHTLLLLLALSLIYIARQSKA